MPEIWIPYGGVESLVTIQAENLGAVAEAPAEGGGVEMERMVELAKGAAQLFVCDATPATMELVRGMLQPLAEPQAVRVFSSAPKRLEAGVPELKGKISTLPPPIPAPDAVEPFFAPELTQPGRKVFVGSARPDPLFGIVDAKVEACLSWVALSRSSAAKARKEMEPEPFQRTEAYNVMQGLAERVPDAAFITAVPRGGKLRAALEGAPFDAVKNAFARTQMAQTRGIVIGAGGKGYDDTLSSAIRTVWSAMGGVRRTGSILLVAECAEGMGSTALEMLVTDRLTGSGVRREKYVDGIEEVFYLNKLKEEYDVLLLSGLPETYASSKLGFTTAKGSGEALGRMLNKVGRSGKLNVVPRAPECFVESG